MHPQSQGYEHHWPYGPPYPGYVPPDETYLRNPAHLRGFHQPLGTEPRNREELETSQARGRAAERQLREDSPRDAGTEAGLVSNLRPRQLEMRYGSEQLTLPGSTATQREAGTGPVAMSADEPVAAEPSGGHDASSKAADERPGEADAKRMHRTIRLTNKENKYDFDPQSDVHMSIRGFLQERNLEPRFRVVQAERSSRKGPLLLIANGECADAIMQEPQMIARNGAITK
jgi:hypothetical protein